MNKNQMLFILNVDMEEYVINVLWIFLNKNKNAIYVDKYIIQI